MKRENTDYKQPENDSFSLQEPLVNYQSNYNHFDKQNIAFVSEEELANNCIPLAESKRLLLERIHRDFHK